MAIVAGIDEAGYGPVLGPLVVSGVAFRVPDDHVDRCLWDTLRASCSARPGRDRRRLVVADSKVLHKSRGSLGSLERAALVMLTAAGYQPSTWRGLLDHVAPGAEQQLDKYPWYRGTDLNLPHSADVGDLTTQATPLRRDLTDHGVVLHGVFCEPLAAGHFNRLVQGTRNKAVVSLGLVLRIVERINRSARGQRVCLFIDRQGGRTRYRDPLMTSLPDYSLEILEESETRSSYRMHRSSTACEIVFVTKAESRHFPVALASVYSKYLRELYMHVFNAYWSTKLPGLRPTAGYYTDGHRWLREAATEIERQSVDRTLLVRAR